MPDQKTRSRYVALLLIDLDPQTLLSGGEVKGEERILSALVVLFFENDPGRIAGRGDRPGWRPGWYLPWSFTHGSMVFQTQKAFHDGAEITDRVCKPVLAVRLHIVRTNDELPIPQKWPFSGAPSSHLEGDAVLDRVGAKACCLETSIDLFLFESDDTATHHVIQELAQFCLVEAAVDHMLATFSSAATPDRKAAIPPNPRAAEVTADIQTEDLEVGIMRYVKLGIT